MFGEQRGAKKRPLLIADGWHVEYARIEVLVGVKSLKVNLGMTTVVRLRKVGRDVRVGLQHSHRQIHTAHRRLPHIMHNLGVVRRRPLALHEQCIIPPNIAIA